METTLIRNVLPFIAIAKGIGCLAIFFSIPVQAAKDSRTWLSWYIPRCHFENLSQQGYVRIIEEIEWFRIDGSTRLPLTAIFDTGEKRVSPLLGKNWHLPLLESTAYPKDSETYIVRMPNHGTDLIFYKIGKGKYRTTKHRDSNWSAELNGDIFRVKSNLGDELDFKSGRLRKLKYSNDRKIHFYYDNKMISEVRDDQNALLLKVEKTKKGECVFKFRDSDNKAKTCILSIKPYLQEGRMESGLSEIIVDGVPQKKIIYGGPQKGTATLEVKYMTAIIEKWRRNIKKENPEDFDEEIEKKMPSSIHRFSWDAKTGIIKTENDWRYTILPPNNEGGYAAMQREDMTGKRGKEFWHYDLLGKETILRADGVLTEREWFTNGPACGKEKRMTSLVDGMHKSVTEYSYDEKGKLFKEMHDGNTIYYFYDKTGNYVGHVRNGRLSSNSKKEFMELYKPFLKNLSGSE
jgi:hypothetical protein